MKNMGYFPFERNRYFYGKLLSVDDFETEQKYFNDKRRLINRYVVGSGIVSGMDVVRVDDNTVSIEAGLALDSSGREIVISHPVILPLSSLEGFETCQMESGKSYYYLCAAYEEREKETIHNVAMSQTSKLESNKMEETFRLFLTVQTPETEIDSGNFCTRSQWVVYRGDGIKIKQEVPKFVPPNVSFPIRITVENMGQNRPFSFQYTLRGDGIEGEQQNDIRVEFDSRQWEDETTCVVEVMAKSLDMEITTRLAVEEESFRLMVGDQQINCQLEEIVHEVMLSSQEPGQLISEEYRKNAMEIIAGSNNQNNIYLAKIWVIHAGSSYVIDRVEQAPFAQYIQNHELMRSLLWEHNQRIRTLEKLEKNKLLSKSENPVEDQQRDGVKISEGTYEFDFGIGAQTGKIYYSPEIPHGLGMGHVTITLSTVWEEQGEKIALFGKSDLFSDNPKRWEAELAVKAFNDRGTFVIAVQTSRIYNSRFAQVHWTAVKKQENLSAVKEERSIKITPDMPDVTVGEDVYFEAALSGFEDSRLQWRVMGETGGVISPHGIYHAPNLSGVYEIRVASTSYPEVEGVTFAIVREADKSKKGLEYDYSGAGQKV